MLVVLSTAGGVFPFMAHNYIAPMPLTVTDKTNADRDWRGDPEFGVSVDLKRLHIEKKAVCGGLGFH